MKNILAFGIVIFGAVLLAGEEAPAWMEKFQPGKEHETLKKREGQYDVVVKMWMDPAAPPTETKGAAEFKMVLNGRFLRQEFKGELMGKPFAGVGYDGYDRTTNKYVGTWVDDFGTGIMQLTGSSKDGGKTIEYHGEQGDPMTGKMVKFRTVHKTVSDDQFIFEMYETHEGKEVKGIEIVYTRKK